MVAEAADAPAGFTDQIWPAITSFSAIVGKAADACAEVTDQIWRAITRRTELAIPRTAIIRRTARMVSKAAEAKVGFTDHI